MAWSADLELEVLRLVTYSQGMREVVRWQLSVDELGGGGVRVKACLVCVLCPVCAHLTCRSTRHG